MVEIAYHTAPVEARELIRVEGLRVNDPNQGTWKHVFGDLSVLESGVFVGPEPDLLGMWTLSATWDIWEVDITDLARESDRLNPGCWRLTVPVPPERLTLYVAHATWSRDRVHYCGYPERVPRGEPTLCGFSLQPDDPDTTAATRRHTTKGVDVTCPDCMRILDHG